MHHCFPAYMSHSYLRISPSSDNYKSAYWWSKRMHCKCLPCQISICTARKVINLYPLRPARALVGSTYWHSLEMECFVGDRQLPALSGKILFKQLLRLCCSLWMVAVSTCGMAGPPRTSHAMFLCTRKCVCGLQKTPSMSHLSTRLFTVGHAYSGSQRSRKIQR